MFPRLISPGHVTAYTEIGSLFFHHILSLFLLLSSSMGGDQRQIYSETGLKENDCQFVRGLVLEVEEDDHFDSESIESSFGDSTNSVTSSSSSDITEDVTSSSTSFSTSSYGPLYELSELMTQLPIKRGLSKHYEGKSQSFTSLGGVQSLEDLAKKENPFNYRRRLMKTCKSYGGGLDVYTFGPRATISKKASRACRLSSASSLGKRNSRVPFLAHNN